MSRSSRLLLSAIGLYQRARTGHLSPCRFVPSCSEYAAEAVTEYGAARGSLLTIRRIARCRPLGGRGYDPVPAK
jgi:uncharacterized protein